MPVGCEQALPSLYVTGQLVGLQSTHANLLLSITFKVVAFKITIASLATTAWFANKTDKAYPSPPPSFDAAPPMEHALYPQEGAIGKVSSGWVNVSFHQFLGTSRIYTAHWTQWNLHFWANLHWTGLQASLFAPWSWLLCYVVWNMICFRYSLASVVSPTGSALAHWSMKRIFERTKPGEPTKR